jgi:hypothetical protein
VIELEMRKEKEISKIRYVECGEYDPIERYWSFLVSNLSPKFVQENISNPNNPCMR